jgi:ATP-dependent Clp protease ATP-binding subunit ClpX
MESETECSFCGRPPEEIEYYVEGPDVIICSLCIDLCAEVLADERAAEEDEDY